MQEFATGLIVALAAAYIVWKVGFAGRSRKKRGPDVPTKALLKKSSASRDEFPGVGG